MTTTASGRQLTSACNGVTTNFLAPACHLNGDLKVYLLDASDDDNDAGTLLSEGADYSVVGDLAVGAGSVTTAVAYPAGKFIRRWRETSRVQDVQIIANQGLPAATQEGMFDRLSLVDQEQDEEIGRAVKVPPGEVLAELPSRTVRAGKFALFDANGNWTVSQGTGADAGLRADLAAPGGSALVNGVREKLQAARTYYVRNDGSDANNGLSNTAGGAFLTLQKAVDTVFLALDLNGHDVTIQAADGARTAGFHISAPQVGPGNIYIFGNVATPANCPVTVDSTDCFKIENNAVIWLRGFKPSTTTSGACLVGYTGAVVNTQAMDWGACAASQIECGQGATVSLDGPYAISGGGVSHLHVGSFGLITSSTFTVTITGNPHFSAYFAGVAQGHIIVPGITWSGTATGMRYLSHFGGLIRGAAIDPAFPGDVQGLANAGGYYIASVVNPQVIAPDTSLNSGVSLRGWNTTSQQQVDRFMLRADATGSANFYCDGDNSYSSGETWFGNDQRTVVASGTQDGLTLYSKAALAAGFPVFELSGHGAAVGYMRRRLSDGVMLQFYRDTSPVGSITVSTTGTTYSTTSDYRLKEDVQPIADPLTRISALKPCNFAWKINGERSDGFLAHELAEVAPQAVTGEKDAVDDDGNPIYQQIEVSRLIPLLVAGMQQIIERTA